MNTRLDQLALDIERQVAGAGWDQPPPCSRSSRPPTCCAASPSSPPSSASRDDVPGGLTPVDQGELPDAPQPRRAARCHRLAGRGARHRAGRRAPDGAARGRAASMPQDESEALRWLAEHPERQEVRIVVAVLRDGSRASALRMRAHDHEQSVLTGADLVPGLAEALSAHRSPTDRQPPRLSAGRSGRFASRCRRAARRAQCHAPTSRLVDPHQLQPVGHRRDGLGAVAGRGQEHRGAGPFRRDHLLRDAADRPDLAGVVDRLRCRRRRRRRSANPASACRRCPARTSARRSGRRRP